MNSEDFCKVLEKYSPHKIVLIGIGNDLRGDDSAGLVFLQRLKSMSEFTGSHFIEVGTNPENYLQKILDLNPEVVVFIDSARWCNKPGAIDWLNSDRIDDFKISTHTFSIKMVEDFIRTQKSMDFLYLGIEPLSTRFSEPLSEVVNKSIEIFFSS